jgi:hypothetical protein
MSNQKIKRNLIVLFYLSLFATLSASPNDSISTVYKNGEYSTYSQVWVNASDTVCCDVTKDFDHQMCYNVELLFGWALKGMNLRKEKKEIMMFYLKNTTFNKTKNELRCIGDVIVPGVITVPNVFVDAKLSSKPYSNGKSTF